MKIQTLQKLGYHELKTNSSAKLDTDLIIAHAIKKNREYLSLHPERRTPLVSVGKILWHFWKRKRSIPLAYIFGEKEWGDMELKVNKHTLIPRSETEVLCHLIAQSFIKEKKIPPKTILDIGTGSGAIAIFFAKIFSKSEIYASDISKKALKIAQENAKNQKVSNIFWQQSDCFKKISCEQKYDLIIANLPYVPQNTLVSKEVKKEPATAIFSGKKGITHIQKLAKEIHQKNIDFGELWLEFLPDQYPSVKKIFKSYKVTPHKNIDGKIFFAKITL